MAAKGSITSAVSSLKDERKWRAEDAMRTLMRAEEYKADKGLMGDVKKLAACQAAKMAAIAKK